MTGGCVENAARGGRGGSDAAAAADDEDERGREGKRESVLVLVRGEVRVGSGRWRREDGSARERGDVRVDGWARAREWARRWWTRGWTRARETRGERWWRRWRAARRGTGADGGGESGRVGAVETARGSRGEKVGGGGDGEGEGG
tara:strand:+ start:19606 stop:20040 length:435 start_codon:yes stop_codon:yes gene_type:complete